MIFKNLYIYVDINSGKTSNNSTAFTLLNDHYIQKGATPLNMEEHEIVGEFQEGGMETWKQ